MSYNDDFLKFDRMVNPLSKKIYHFTSFNTNYAAKDSFIKIEPLYNAAEILALMPERIYRNIKVDISKTEYCCIDIDDEAGYKYLKERFNKEGVSFIEVSSSKAGRSHFYLKKSDKFKPKYNILNYDIQILDYYFRNRINPASMVLPRPENNRLFINIPDIVSYTPDYIFE